MKASIATLGLAMSAWISGCAVVETMPNYCAQTAQSGSIVCSKNSTTSCELSAVAWVPGWRAGELVFGNDKQPADPDESSVFSIPFSGGLFDAQGAKTFYTHAPFAQVRKFESMAVSPDGQHVIALNAFDRFDPVAKEFDRFNVGLGWSAKTPQNAQVLAHGN